MNDEPRQPLTIDLNCDLGETLTAWPMSDEALIYPLITSANLACGFHAGDPSTMIRATNLALQHNVRIGAHPGYHDLVGFGRRAMDIDLNDLFADVLYQVSALGGIVRSRGGELAYIKPHGALYNRIWSDTSQATAVVRVAETLQLPLMGMPGSAACAIAIQRGVPFITEGFADRGYRADGTLLSRLMEGAVIEEPATVSRRAVQMVLNGTVETVDGTEIALRAASLCTHGDNPAAVEILRDMRQALEDVDINITSSSAG